MTGRHQTCGQYPSRGRRGIRGHSRHGRRQRGWHPYFLGWGWMYSGPQARREGSVLVLKAGKSDIDAFAKGQLDSDGFRREGPDRHLLRPLSSTRIGTRPAVLLTGALFHGQAWVLWPYDPVIDPDIVDQAGPVGARRQPHRMDGLIIAGRRRGSEPHRLTRPGCRCGTRPAGRRNTHQRPIANGRASSGS